MNKYVMGIDGGGTKSHLAVCTTDGELVGMARYGALNHEGMEGSFAQMERELGGFVGESLAKLGVAPVELAGAVLGLAGADTTAQVVTLSAMVTRLGIDNFVVTNDAYLGIPAVAPSGYGICAINGTGSAVAAIDRDGSCVQVGGIGELSDDCGGSTWYGAQAVGQVYNELFRSGPPTQMTQLLMTEIGASGTDGFVDRLVACIDEGSTSLERLNRLVFAAATAGDAVALHTLARSADSYAGSIAHLAATMSFPEGERLSVTLAGSIFVKEPCKVLPRMIQRRVQELLPTRTVDLVRLAAPPVAGAVIWALSRLGLAFDRTKICTALSAIV